MSQYKECTQGPCWDDYIYIGPKPKTRGSCIKKSKVCKKKSHKCNKKVSCGIKKKKKYDIVKYKTCLKKSKKNTKIKN